MTCYYQVFKKPNGIIMTGWGDCRTCVTHEDNQKCRGFISIKADYFDILEADYDKKTTQATKEAKTTASKV